MANWEFRGAAGFEAWARERPWLNGGGLCVLRLRTTGAGDMLHGPICGLVRAAHGDERRLSIQRVECGAGHGSPMQALLASIELRPDLNPFEAKDLLGVRFREDGQAFGGGSSEYASDDDLGDDDDAPKSKCRSRDDEDEDDEDERPRRRRNRDEY